MFPKDKKCIPCEGGVEPVAVHEIETYLRKLTIPWELVDSKKIRRTFVFKDFKQAISFVNEVADSAEFEGHHPDIFISWNKVVLTLWTHSIGGLSENDFAMADTINRIEIIQPKN